MFPSTHSLWDCLKFQNTHLAQQDILHKVTTINQLHDGRITSVSPPLSVSLHYTPDYKLVSVFFCVDV